MDQPTVDARRRFPSFLVALTLFGLSAAGGIGYYAWQLRTTHLGTVEALDGARVELVALGAERDKAALLGQQLDTCRNDNEAASERCRAVEQDNAAIRGNLDTTRTELDELRRQRGQTAARLEAFKALTAKFQKMIDKGKLNVAVRNGQMSVKLPAGVLFDSGSAELSRDGELALMEVAIVLREFDDRRFMVAGHTDDRPLESAQPTARFRNNWELSTARAVTVTQFLIEARMKPESLVAAGYGQFDPVGNNKTSAGQQENRRIEIVLLPNIEELPVIPPDPSEAPAAP